MKKNTKKNMASIIKKETVKDRIEKNKSKNELNKKSTNHNVEKKFKNLANKDQIKKDNLLKKILHIIGLVILPRYVRNSWEELKSVTWPNFKLSRQLTTAVIIFAIFFGVSVYYLDNGLAYVFKLILLK